MLTHRLALIVSTLGLVILTSCGPNPLKPVGAKKQYSAQIGLIDFWSPEKQAKEPYKPPFVIQYSDGMKSLDFISVNHSTGIESPVFRTLKEEIEHFRPEVVIIEGYPTAQGYSPAEFIEKTQKFIIEQFQYSIEPFYAGYLAHRIGIPFIGGEPTNQEIFNAIRSMDVTARDMAGFYAMRTIPQWKLESMFTDVNKRVDDTLKGTFESIGVHDPDFRIRELTRWYQEKTGRRLKIDNLTVDDTRPNYEPDAPYLQRFASMVERARNEHILQVIVEQLNRHDKVLIEYGSGHHVELRRALRAILPTMTAKKLY